MSDREEIDENAELTALLVKKRELEVWMELPVTKTLFALLQADVDLMQNQILLQPLGSADDVFKQEFQKGELKGRVSLQNILDTQMSNLEYDIANLRKGNENEK